MESFLVEFHSTGVSDRHMGRHPSTAANVLGAPRATGKSGAGGEGEAASGGGSGL